MWRVHELKATCWWAQNKVFLVTAPSTFWLETKTMTSSVREYRAPFRHVPVSELISTVPELLNTSLFHVFLYMTPPGVSDSFYSKSIILFSSFTFIKNMPSQSQHSRPQLRDIPPKTRSTPEATLVVDLVSLILWSFLLSLVGTTVQMWRDMKGQINLSSRSTYCVFCYWAFNLLFVAAQASLSWFSCG